MAGVIFNRRRTDSAVRLGVIAIVCFFFFRYFSYFGLSRPEAVKSLLEDRLPQKQTGLKKANKTNLHIHKVDGCQEVNLAWKCQGSQDAIELFWSLKTILYYRTTPLNLFIYADDTSKYILETMFETWELPCVDVTFLKGSPKKTSFAAVSIPHTIQNAIYLKSQMRFLADVKELYDLFLSKNKEKPLFDLPEKWNINPSSNKETSRVKSQNDVKAFSVQPPESYYNDNKVINTVVEHLNSILQQASQIYSKIADKISSCSCAKMAAYKTETPLPHNNITALKPCLEFVKYAYSQKRKLLYFFGNRNTQYKDETDISVATQLTLDRFHVLEHFAQKWKGPMVVVLYVSDVDAFNLQTVLAGSAVRSRKNIDIHLVFKRKHFYPINELRNVAVKEVKTAYTLFVDIDLVPNPTIYEDLKKYIKKYIIPEKGLNTLIVPAFEALVDIKQFPDDKPTLLKYIQEKKVDGYKMWRQWNLGHKPTDYPKWMKTNESYVVKWRDAYEPYVVLKTKDIPVYEPALLERMGDKIAYGLQLYAMGYNFRVLPDVYVVHLPHPTSPGTNLWARNGKYAGCSGKLFQAYKQDIFKKYPNKRY